MSNTAEFLVSQTEGEELSCEQGGQTQYQPVGLKELDHHLRPLVMAEEEIAECISLYPDFRCFWNGNIVFVVQGSSVKKIIQLADQQIKILNRRLRGEDCPWIKGPEMASGQDVEPGVLVLDQAGRIVLASEFDRNKERESNPFPIAPAMRKSSARWIVLIFDKYDRNAVINKMVLMAKESMVDLCSPKPHVLIDTYLWQSREAELLPFRTRKVNLDPLRSEDAKILDQASRGQPVSIPNSALRWWRRLQELVPRHGCMITVFTPMTAGAFLHMVHWAACDWDWKFVPDLLKPGGMITLRWTLKGIRLSHQTLIHTDR